MGPLQILEPLVALSGALSAGLSAILGFAFIATLVMPSVLVLLASTPGHGVWRWPFAWWGPSLIAVLLLGRVLPQSVEEMSTIWWIALGTYAAWAMLVTLIGSIQLLLRTARFVFQPAHRTPPIGAFGRLLYGWGAAFCGSLILLCAVLGAAPKPGWQVLWALAIGLFSVLTLKRRGEAATTIPPNVAARLLWLAGSMLVAIAGPVALVFVAAVVAWGPLVNGGLSKGVPIAVVSVLLCAGGVWMMRRGLRTGFEDQSRTSFESPASPSSADSASS